LLLFNFYVANAVACYQRWQRSSTAVNMTSVWKRSIRYAYGKNAITFSRISDICCAW